MATSIHGPSASVQPSAAHLQFPALAAGEFVASLLPLFAGLLAAHEWDLEEFALWGVLVAAGLLQGLVLGASQAAFVKRAIPRLNSALWIAATGISLAVAWAFAWLAPTYAARGEPTGIVAAIAMVGIGVSVIALGVPQSEVLSFARVRYPYSWFGLNAIVRGLSLIPVGIAAILVDWSGPPDEIVAAFVAAAVAHALIAAFLTGKAIEWVARLGAPAASEA